MIRRRIEELKVSVSTVKESMNTDTVNKREKVTYNVLLRRVHSDFSLNNVRIGKKLRHASTERY